MTTCDVCCENDTIFPADRVATCSCGATVCNACHRDYLLNQRKFVTLDMASAAVPCMTRGCTGTYTSDALQRLLTVRADRDTVLERLATACWLEMPQAVVCSRRECGVRLTVDAPDPDDECTSVVCLRCANAMCLLCCRDAHDGMTCEEYEERASNGAWTSEKLINQISRCCPKCRFRVFRVGGCPHMTCSRCSHQWCYGCLGPIGAAGGTHATCYAVAAQFERAGVRLLADLRDEAKMRARQAKKERDQARAIERAQRNARREAERLERLARGQSEFVDEEEDFSAFNPWEAFETATAPPPPPPDDDDDEDEDVDFDQTHVLSLVRRLLSMSA